MISSLATLSASKREAICARSRQSKRDPGGILICRNKMVVQIQHPEHRYMLPSDPKEGTFRNWWGSWGCHQVMFYGDLRQSLKEFAALTGFEIVGDQ